MVQRPVRGSEILTKKARQRTAAPPNNSKHNYLCLVLIQSTLCLYANLLRWAMAVEAAMVYHPVCAIYMSNNRPTVHLCW